jgi:hypothetical protein
MLGSQLKARTRYQHKMLDIPFTLEVLEANLDRAECDNQEVET